MLKLESTKKIEGYNVGEFVANAIAASKLGYKLDFDTNEHAPRNFGSYYACVMILDYSDVLDELTESTSDTQSDTTAEPKVRKSRK